MCFINKVGMVWYGLNAWYKSWISINSMNLGISRLYCPSLPKLNVVQWATALCLSKLLEDPVFLCSRQTLYSIYLWLSIFEHIIKCNCKTTGLTSLDSHNSKQLWISGCDCAAATWHYVMFFFFFMEHVQKLFLVIWRNPGLWLMSLVLQRGVMCINWAMVGEGVVPFWKSETFCNSWFGAFYF